MSEYLKLLFVPPVNLPVIFENSVSKPRTGILVAIWNKLAPTLVICEIGVSKLPWIVVLRRFIVFLGTINDVNLLSSRVTLSRSLDALINLASVSLLYPDSNSSLRSLTT